MIPWVMTITAVAVSGCAPQRAKTAPEPEFPPSVEVVVVAPVLNLSDRSDWDELRVTDWLASELSGFHGAAVVPVNRTLAALEVAGLRRVESPEDARALARLLGADATLVAAVTEFSPYEPVRIAWVMQWYETDGVLPAERGGAALASEPGMGEPAVQVQRVFSAADEEVLEEVRDYADDRDGHGSPYDWRVYVKSQELFVRYSCWSAIQSMLTQRGGYRTQAPDHSAE